jgi:vancomycin resistance protein YoaR
METVGESHNWPIRVVYRPGTLHKYLDALANGMRTEPADATLDLVETAAAKRLVLRPSQEGRRLAGLEAAREFDFDPGRPRTVLVDLTLEVAAPDVATDALRQVVDGAGELLQGRIRLVSPDAVWKIDRAELASALTLEDNDGELTPKFVFGGDEFGELLDQIEAAAYLEPVEPRIKLDTETAQFMHLTDPANGSYLDRNILLRRLEAAAAGGEASVEVPIVVMEPQLVNASPESLGLTGNFGIGTSYFGGSSWNRAYNIEVGAAKLDGTIIEPGQVFDFNEALGPIGFETGFVEGMIIINNKTIPGIGGGICQVSTTMFRAAFLAGLPITERWQHVYRVRYYELGDGHPPGFDASIYQPTLNMLFTNDTDNYLMIRSEFHWDAGRLRFYLIGSPSRRRVEMNAWATGASEPGEPRFVANPELAPGERKQTDWPIWGLKTGLERQVFQGDELLFEDEFISNFRAWSARWEVGPDAEGNIDTSGLEED